MSARGIAALSSSFCSLALVRAPIVCDFLGVRLISVRLAWAEGEREIAKCRHHNKIRLEKQMKFTPP